GVDKRVTLIVGDLAFLYDLNALSMLKDLVKPMTVILLNNDGGGIFEFFPVSKLKNTYTKFFETPHGLTFHKAAELFNLNYAQSKSLSEFKKDYAQALKSEDSTIIEIQTNKKENFELQQKLRQQIKKFTNNRGE
nr:2-succinyl-5-enolpyruvyl-6-hydroxy-3-cyclohexene-1-carboxylate synthase [Candidatus Omnitrophota bacterium]